MIFPNAQKTSSTLQPLVELENCLAKTVVSGGKLEKGCDVYTHLFVTCCVVRKLQDIFKNTPRQSFLKGAAEWLCALHDIGKVTPDFQRMIWGVLRGEPVGKSLYPHNEYSGWILRMFGEVFARMAAAHHGKPCERKNPAFNNENDLCGGANWAKMRLSLIERLKTDLLLPDCEMNVPSTIEDVVLGATILSDWLSSSMEISWHEMPGTDRISDVVMNAGFIKPQIRKGLSFGDIFDGYEPNGLQRKCLCAPKRGDIFVIESEMGSGKTEAALYLAYKMLENDNANGIYFALPTQLTSEKIHERMNMFLEKVLSDGTHKGAMLIHGDAWMQWALSAERDDLSVSSGYADEWFQSKKRALLAPFGVGTIDQALMSVINVRHKSLRAFALSGKVVIIDEIHSYDFYTSSLIRMMVEKLRDWGCTVILLSATLTNSARQEFSLTPQSSGNDSGLVGYPMLTCNHLSGTVEEIPIAPSEDRSVDITLVSEEELAFQVAMERALNGEQVLWIENTVPRAQSVYQRFASAHCQEIEIGLIHSRFPKCIRESNEMHWVTLLGKRGIKERVKKGRILIGTQVLEQSLDIDADFLVTRLAPMDMVLQRIGRLWRHPQLDLIRPSAAKRQVLVIYDSILENIEDERVSVRRFLPYESYVILRTFRVFKNTHCITIPRDVRWLVESTYSEVPETGIAAFLKNRLLEKKEELERKAVISSSGIGGTVNDDLATTRINESPQVDLLLILKGNHGVPVKRGTKLVWTPFDESPLEIPPEDSNRHQMTKASAALRKCLITVPDNQLGKDGVFSVRNVPMYSDFPTEFLSSIIWVGNEEVRPVRAAYVDDDGVLLNQSGLPLPFMYSQDIGLQRVKE